MYKKPACSSGLLSQLYEIKLISLLYLRAFHDNAIEEFQIASNVDKMGSFGDICFKTKVKGFNKPISAFIQAKHMENKKQMQINLLTYFISYLKIRQHFDPNNKDLFFNSKYDETECLFVIYTNTSIDYSIASNNSIESDFSAKLNDLIGTGGTVTQEFRQEKDVKFLRKVAMKEDMTCLAERIAKCINDNGYFEMLLSDETVQRYHVILTQKVFDLSEIKPDGYRIARFRHDFFDTHEEYLSIFKDTLFTEILKKRKIEPTNTTHTYTAHTYNTELAAREILSILRFKVPAAFGNKDLTIRGSDAKIEKRMNYLVLKFIDLLAGCKSSNIVTIDNSLHDAFLQLDGGIAGAIGNVFELDENTNLMKITDNWEQLGPLAKRLYLKLNSTIHNLHEYKFCFNVNNFPKLSIESDIYEENLMRDFLSRLQIYSNQANENGLEYILKKEIGNQFKTIQGKTEAEVIYLSYHDHIQKWWMLPAGAEYLTRETKIFQNVLNLILRDREQIYVSAMNLLCKRKILAYNFTFSKDAVNTLNLQYHSYTIITAENSILAVIKVMQHLKDKKYNVIHLDYVANLPTNDRYALREELKYTNFNEVLVILCNNIQQVFEDKQHKNKNILEIIADRPNNTIIVTNDTPFQILRNYFPNARIFLNDEKVRLIDLSEETQKRIFETATASFPGGEIRLDLLLRGWTKPGSRSAGEASAAADSDIGKGSQFTGDEKHNVPGTS